MRVVVLILWLFLPCNLVAQTIQDTTVNNKRYFEDQFYGAITYNFILNAPQEVDQRNFSYGLQAGFIKDIPLNENRNIGLGFGLGLGLNTYYTNIRATQIADIIQYSLPQSSVDARRSKLETHLLEMPFEFRWRNSNATDYSFWRIYAGIKFSYLINARSKFVGVDLNNNDQNFKESFNNNDLKNFQYGLTFNFGYHNFNMHVYYALTGLFTDQVILESEALNLTPLRVGFIFYIL